ncbi:MAG: DEAD/DEAH box helicase, partial [Burkholderiales bacterium]|nr:DEAD/DEAH box helicase [Anaerolineae bacterium]
SQIGESFTSYGRYTGLKNIVIFGGVGQQPQVQALRRGPDILVATPGRLLDLMNQGMVKLNSVEVFVLDEADRMLDMGFIHDVRRVISALPTKRQTLLFSATMPQDIQDLADRILDNPVHIEVTPQATTVEKIDQSVYFVDKKDKPALLAHLLGDRAIRRVLVFTRTKHGANKLVQHLERGYVQAEAIHGNKSQTARERALENFKSGKTRVLVATDIAARGIDVDDVTHVINYDLPNIPESYVHRIGRTARAGASGIAFSFCDSDEREFLRDIEKLIRLRVPVVSDHPFVSSGASASLPVSNSRGGGQRQQSWSGRPASDGGRSRSGGSSNGQANRNSGGLNGQPSRASNGSTNGQPSRASNGGTNGQPNHVTNGGATNTFNDSRPMAAVNREGDLSHQSNAQLTGALDADGAPHRSRRRRRPRRPQQA